MPEPIFEFERKFLVADPGVLSGQGEGSNYLQGYMSDDPASHVRVRIKVVSQVCTLAVKGPRQQYARQEQEWNIDAEMALALFEASPGKIEKRRFGLGEFWTVDVFGGANEGLVLAEYEHPDAQRVASLQVPNWCGREVTDDERFYNQSLAFRPWQSFADEFDS